MDKRVLQIVHGLGMGGAEKWLLAVARYLSGRTDVKLDFLITSGAPSVLDAEFAAVGCGLMYVKYSGFSQSAFRRGVNRVISTGRYLAVHDHQDIQSGFHFGIRSISGIPVRVSHFHNPFFQVEKYLSSWARRGRFHAGKFLTQKRSTHIRGTSRTLLSEYGLLGRGKSAEFCKELYCGFDVSEFKRDCHASSSLRNEFSWRKQQRVVLFAGRMDWEFSDSTGQHKNSSFALRVVHQLLRYDDSIVALFVGQASPALPFMEAMTADAGFAGRIRFIGIRHDMNRLMSGADVLLFPSGGEGLGMVAVEAQASGLPVVASTAVPKECVVIPDLVRFVSLNSSVSDWVKEVMAAIESRDIIDADEAYLQVSKSHFAIESSANSLLELYSGGCPVA